MKVITKGEGESDRELSPKVKSLKGSSKAPKGFNYKKELSKQLSEKYLFHNPEYKRL